MITTELSKIYKLLFLDPLAIVDALVQIFIIVCSILVVKPIRSKILNKYNFNIDHDIHLDVDIKYI